MGRPPPQIYLGRPSPQPPKSPPMHLTFIPTLCTNPTHRTRRTRPAQLQYPRLAITRETHSPSCGDFLASCLYALSASNGRVNMNYLDTARTSTRHNAVDIYR